MPIQVRILAKTGLRTFVGMAFPTICPRVRSEMPTRFAAARCEGGNPCKPSISSTVSKRFTDVMKDPPSEPLLRVIQGALFSMRQG